MSEFLHLIGYIAHNEPRDDTLRHEFSIATGSLVTC
jgi:hypothetical protein